MIFEKNEQFEKEVGISCLDNILSNYVTNKVANYSLFNSGSENSTYLINLTDKSSLVLRVSSINLNNTNMHKAEDLIKNEITFCHSLKVKGLNVVNFKRTIKNELYIKQNWKGFLLLFCVMEFIEGREGSYSDIDISKSSKALAQFHQESTKVNNILKVHENNHYSMEYRLLSEGNSDLENDIYLSYKKIYDKISRELKFFYNSSKNKQYIHGDPKADNFIFKEKKELPYFIDFGDYSYSVRHEDIGIYLWDLTQKCNNFSLSKKIETFFYSYNEVYPLTNNEKYISLLYAVNRFLSINLHYLKVNQKDELLYKYQLNKATIQGSLINDLLKLAKEYEYHE